MILIVHSLWNESVTGLLKDGALEVLRKNFPKQEIKSVAVPGALEVAIAIQWEYERAKKSSDPLIGVVACGCIVKGETYHFEIVANESARAITDIALKLNIPISNAILTTYDFQQAFDRAHGKMGNKGAEAAEALVHMLKMSPNI